MTQTLSAQNPGLQHAVALHKSGRLADAAAEYRKLLDVSPQDPRLLSGLGGVVLQMGGIDDSIKLLVRSLEIDPDQAAAFFNLGIAHTRKKQFKRALASYDRAIAIRPNFALAYFNRGEILEKFGRPGQALACFDRTLAIRPDLPMAHFKRGQLLEKLNRADEALASFTRVLELNPSPGPSDAAIHVNCGVLLQNAKRFDEALASYDRAIVAKPDYPEAYWFKSLALLLIGDYEQGWLLHEWRWKSSGYKRLVRNFHQPLWLGEQPVAGKTLLLHAEVGLGDSIQFCRYISMVEALGAKIILEVPTQLVSLVQTLAGGFTVVEKGRPLPDFDLHCPAMSLPLVFKTTINSVPATIPYLHADPGKQALWRQRLGIKDKPRIGLIWSGLMRGNIDANPAKKRSIPLRLLEPLLRLPLEFHSLQKDYLTEDIALLKEFTQIRTHQDELHDFSDTAALVREMDLVISIDTSVAHLVGALGHPLWILLPYVTDYRWTLDGATTPWYPDAKLFRQSAISDWNGVISKVVQQLAPIFHSS